jgi:serine O-acetyltransferase
MFKATVRKDLIRYKKKDGLSALLTALFNPCFRFVFLLRLCSYSSRFSPHGMFFRLWFKSVQRRYGFQIPHNTRIGGGLFLSHYGGIVINPKTIIGDNCNIAQGVTIGQINTGKKMGCPVIGKRVWIGPNAVVVGNITIGDGALIAPLAYVNFDVPENALVLGNPAKIVNDSGSQGYVNNLAAE